MKLDIPSFNDIQYRDKKHCMAGRVCQFVHQLGFTDSDHVYPQGMLTPGRHRNHKMGVTSWSDLSRTQIIKSDLVRGGHSPLMISM